ncbi:MAG: anhydro-N-acetylmuramic acid kinase, partial [Acidobacteria bacterium]|nr:anhydro-N-acetylmuramic acid kinase [Acidobacteriota bacterium]
AHVASGHPSSASAISQMNFLLGELFSEAALAVCRRAKVSPKKLSVIGSHGQTIYHQGTRSREAGREISSTMQIAEPAVIAERTGAPVVADFRSADMAAGGQGAPLVPMVDYLLLRDTREGRVALNIGGIANVTVIPAGPNPEDVFGFDTGPGNMVIDALVRHFTKGRRTFDGGGKQAARGESDEALLGRLLRLSIFQRKPPRSFGREEFGEAFVKRFFLRKRLRAEDPVRTATELTARSIVATLNRFVFRRVKIHRLIVSGGGAKNKFLMKRLQELLPEITINPSDDFGLPIDAKEAIAFAILADRTMHGLPGNLPSVTGARRSVVVGKIVRP